MDERWNEIREVHKQYRRTYEIGGGFTAVMFLLLVGAILFANGALNDYSTNVFTEAVSAVASVLVTVLILDRRAEQREERRRKAELRVRLLRDVGSTVNATAVNAVRELRAHNWLVGDEGVLAGKSFMGANLQGADLWEANLEGTVFEHANLQKAHLSQANLAGAFLIGADLRDAELLSANLRNAQLTVANLQNATLWHANLEGADLWKTTFSDNTLLPDTQWGSGNSKYTSSSYWTPDTDMIRFTDPNHPEFWRPAPDMLGQFPWWYELNNPEG